MNATKSTPEFPRIRIDVLDRSIVWFVCDQAQKDQGWSSMAKIEIRLGDGTLCKLKVARSVLYDAKPWLIRLFQVWEIKTDKASNQHSLSNKEINKCKITLSGLSKISPTKFLLIKVRESPQVNVESP